MSEVKFTTGPWHLCAHLQNINEEIGCSCGYRGVIFGPEDIGYAICQPGHESSPAGQEGTGPPRYSRETEIANAHLIAAAPDLYEALYRLTRDCEIVGLQEQAGLDCWISMANAALAKARGEAQ